MESYIFKNHRVGRGRSGMMRAPCFTISRELFSTKFSKALVSASSGFNKSTKARKIFWNFRKMGERDCFLTCFVHHVENSA